MKWLHVLLLSVVTVCPDLEVFLRNLIFRSYSVSSRGVSPKPDIPVSTTSAESGDSKEAVQSDVADEREQVESAKDLSPSVTNSTGRCQVYRWLLTTTPKEQT